MTTDLPPLADESTQTERLAPAVVRDVLERLSARNLPATPENFGWMYRQVMHARNIQVGVQYTNELDALRHALAAFEDLLVGNAWLAGRFKTLDAVIDDAGRSTRERAEHARIILNEIGANKTQTMLQMARLITETRESINEMLQQVSELADRVAAGRASFERAEALIEQCADLSDFKVALRAIASDVRLLHRATRRTSQSVATSFGQYATSAPYLFGPPRVGVQARDAN